MNPIIVFIGLITLTAAQFLHPAHLDIPGVTPPPWQGPFADHVIGHVPNETPEVLAAKQALNQAYSEVLAVLPELPAEDRYRVNIGPVGHFPIVPHQLHDHHVVSPVVVIPSANIKPVVADVLAEDIPRSALGEVPEVHAARVAHLKAYQDALASLPRLVETTPAHSPVVNLPPIPVARIAVPPTEHLYAGFPQDTPEVAQAKAEHARIVASLYHL